MFYFGLCERLGWRSVEEMLCGMSSAELTKWAGLEELRAKEAEKQKRMADKNMAAKRGTSRRGRRR